MSRARVGGVRGVVEGIDRRIAELDRNLESVPGWMAERRSLLAARRELTGESGPSPVPGVLRRVTRDEVAGFLVEHPGSRAAVIARGLGVALTTISQHLHRGRGRVFERREDGWYVMVGDR